MVRQRQVARPGDRRQQLMRTIQQTARAIQTGYRVGTAGYRAYKRVRPYADSAYNYIKRPKILRNRPGLCGRKRVRNVRKTVVELKRQVNQNLATHTHRTCETGRIYAPTNYNQQTVSAIAHAGQLSHLEAALGNLRFYDSSTNTIVTKDLTTLTAQQKIEIKNQRVWIEIKNSYDIPCIVHVYAMTPKIDTSNSASSYYTNGLTDEAAPSSTSPLVYPSDSINLRQAWAFKKHVKRVLQPGKTMKVSYNLGSYCYDNSLVDLHTLIYQKKLNGFNWLLRVHGVLGHDTTLDEQTLGGYGIDYRVGSTFKIEYNAGVKLDDISINDTSGTITNNFTTGVRPQSNNQSISVT